MNTKKLLFGFMSIAFLAMSVVATDVVSEEDLTSTTQIEKGRKAKI